MITHLKVRRSGFSLIETMIVLAILAISATLGYGYMVAARPHAQLERASDELAAELSGARNSAISRETGSRVRFSGSQYWTESYNRDTDSWTEETAHKTLPDLIDFSSGGNTFPSRIVYFTPRGTLMTGGAITMENTTGETYTFTGNLATGKFPLEGGNLR